MYTLSRLTFLSRIPILLSRLRPGAGASGFDLRRKMKSLILSFVLLTCSHAFAEEAKVSLHLLDHTDRQRTETRFWIDWNKNWRGIVSSKVLTGQPAEEIILTLRQSLETTEATHFCGHNPIYGIEAIDAEGKGLKTSLCFSCLTWVKPGLRLNIAGERGAGNELCRKLREVIELPEELLKAEPPAEKAAGERNDGEESAEAPESR